MTRRHAPRWLIALAALAALLQPQLPSAQEAAQSDAVRYPLGSRIGLVPPPGIEVSQAFPGFEDRASNVFIRLIPMPEQAYAEIEKTMTNEALRKQGLTVERRENFVLPGGKGMLLVARQEANAVHLRKWMLIAPISDLTALVSFEIPDEAKDRYPEAAVRTALASVAARAAVPVDEQLELLPFQLTELGGLRVARVVPGLAVQLTDGPKDDFGADQPHLIVSIARGTPPEARDRDKFARAALSGLPPLKDVRITSSESMRIAGQQGHEIRGEAKDPDTGTDMLLVQWLRFGTGGFMHIVGVAKKDGWTANFMRFRAVRDGVAPR